jgi:hypothetical protein
MIVEIYLSMAGAEQHDDTGFILVPVVGRTSSRCALKALYCVAPRCLQRGLQVWRERRRSLHVLEVRLRQSANIVVKAENMQVCCYPSSPRPGDHLLLL